MASVFDHFKEINYTFLEISRGEVYGNRILSARELSGIFKQRANSVEAENIEVRKSNSTIHAHPEDFAGMKAPELIGQGVRVEGVDYQIVNVSSGTNFDSGEVEHLTFTLEEAEYA